MNEFIKNNGFWYLWVPLLLVLIPVLSQRFKLNSLRPVRWIKKKMGDSICSSLITLFNISVPIAIGGIQIVSSCNEKDYRDAWVFGFFYLAIEIIVILIESYNRLLPQTKEFYDFNERYSGIQKQWDLIKEKNTDVNKKKSFIEESLTAIERAIHDFEIHYYSLSDDNIEKFAMTAGSVYKDYILLCSSKNRFYNVIFASLYRYLFNEYKTKVLSPIKPNSNESADLIIPEFVSNGLTQTIIDNSNIVEYQHNTSVSTIEDFENNVNEGTELKGSIKTDFLKRIIITDEINSPQNINVKIIEKILKWHKTSRVELKFISKTEAEACQREYSDIDRLDFSIIKMSDSGYFILGADRTSINQIAGEKHEMYSVKCFTTQGQTQPDGDKLFKELWDKAKIGKIVKGKIDFY